MPDFTIEASVGLDRITVGWDDGEACCYFVAKVKGDEIVEIEGGVTRKFPTIYRRLKGGGRNALGYENATKPEYAAVVEEARRWIRSGKRASQAIATKRAEVAARVLQQTENKARYIREAMIPLLTREGRIALAGIQDAPLAEVYDSIQNSAL